MTQPEHPEDTQNENTTIATQFDSDGESDTSDTGANPAPTDAADPGNHPDLRPEKRHVLAYIIVPTLVMCLAGGAGYLKYREGSVVDAQAAAAASVQAATDGTVALLSYSPDTAQTTLTAARDRLTGSFRDSYTSLTNDVVIPGSKQKGISATATVPAAASVSATDRQAVVLVYVDQSVIVGSDAPSATASAVQVTLDKIDDRWLISGFDPK